MFLKLFPLWAPLAAILGFLYAAPLTGWGGAIVPLLTVVMLCMGLTLKPKDFIAVGKYRYAFLAGMALQFTVMPLTALLIATLFRLGPDLTVGLMLVGSVAGGTASNIMTFLAKGNVALSVAMTATSTLAGMQNSGLATALALKFFSPVAALPGAIFSVWLNITGSVFAAVSTREKITNDVAGGIG